MARRQVSHDARSNRPASAKYRMHIAATALPIMIDAWMKSVQITALIPPSVV